MKTASSVVDLVSEVAEYWLNWSHPEPNRDVLEVQNQYSMHGVLTTWVMRLSQDSMSRLHPYLEEGLS